MVNGRRIWAAGLLLVLLFAVTATTAAAQSGGDKVVMGGNYTLPANQTLNSRLIVLGGNASLETNSTVNGDVTVMGGNLQANGRISGDVAVFGGSVSLGSTAVVEGSVHSWGGSLRRAAGAQVRGTVQDGPGQAPRLPVPPIPPQPLLRDVPGGLGARGPVNTVLAWIVRFFTALLLGFLLAVVGLVVMLVAPRQTTAVAAAMAAQPAVSFVVGLLTLIVAILLSFVLVWLCGLGLLVLLLAVVAFVFGWIAAGLWLGQRLMQIFEVRGVSDLAAAAVGVFLITWLAVILPSPWWCCLGWLFTLVVGSTGVGAVLLTRFGTQPAAGISGWPGPGGPGGAGGGLISGRSQTLRPAEYTGGTNQASSTSQVVEGPAPAMAPDQVARPDVENQEAPVSNERGVQPAVSGGGQVPAAGESSTTGPARFSLEDLESVKGITPEIAARLRQSGNTTLVALATSDPEALASAAGVSAEQVRQQDWVGQARQLLG